MMEVEPKSLSFQDVRLNQSYSTSLCISNPLAASVEFTLRPSTPRYTISPNRVNLSPGQSIVVTVRLFLSHYPNYARGVHGQEDAIHLKSSYFDQRINVTFFLHSRDAQLHRPNSRSQSPVRSSSVPDKQKGRSESLEIVQELQAQIALKNSRIKVLEDTVGNLESKHPSIQQIVKNKIEQERATFEEKSEKV